MFHTFEQSLNNSISFLFPMTDPFLILFVLSKSYGILSETCLHETVCSQPNSIKSINLDVFSLHFGVHSHARLVLQVSQCWTFYVMHSTWTLKNCCNFWTFTIIASCSDISSNNSRQLCRHELFSLYGYGDLHNTAHNVF